MNRSIGSVIFKLRYLLLLAGACLMEKALFRLGWVQPESIVPFFMFALVAVMGLSLLSKTEEDRLIQSIFCRRGACIILTALSFAFFTVFGSIRILYTGSPLRILFDTAVTFCGLAFLFALFLVYAYRLLDEAVEKQKTAGATGPGEKKAFLRNYVISVVICMLCWMPLFLRFFPGSFGADSINQIRQAMHLAPYGNHLPVISTWVIEILYNIGFALTRSVNGALAFYTVFQMLITACTYGACISYLEFRGAGRLIRGIALGIFALLPMVAMYAIYIHKDTPAADLLLLLIIYLDLLLVYDRKKERLKGKQLVLFGVLGFFFMIFRSNHFYIYPALILCIVLMVKNSKKATVIVMAVALMAAAVYKGPFLKGLGITGADAVETLSMPLVMVSYTLSVDGRISDEDRAFIDNMLPCERLAEVYSETSANPVKKAIRYEGNKQFLEEHKGEFAALFLRVFTRNPAACLVALTDHSKGYYCPKYSHPELIMGTWENDFGAFTDSKLPEAIGGFVYETAQTAYDLYEKYLGCAMSFWLTLLLMLYAISRRRSPLPYLPSVAVVGTFILASPNVGRFRYQYPVMVAAIVLWALTMTEKEE